MSYYEETVANLRRFGDTGYHGEKTTATNSSDSKKEKKSEKK